MRDFVAARRARCAYPSLRSQFTQFWRRAPTEPEGGAMNKNITVVLVLVLAAPCSSRSQDGAYVPPPMDPTRKVSRQVCTRIIHMDGGNLMCIELTEAQRRAELEENKGIAGQITTFLSKARKVEPCPPANSTPQLSRTDNQLAKPR